MPPKPLAHSHWIEPGRILAGEHPGADGELRTKPRLTALLDAGISYFIDLTQSGELPAYAADLPNRREAGRRAIVHVRHAIPDHGVPDGPQFLSEILDDIQQALEAGHRVYIHCRAGIGRTNLVAACWLSRRGLAPKAALEELQRLWTANERSETWRRVPESSQEKYFLQWRDQLAAAPASASRLALRSAEITREDRYRGALVGMACGDALGSMLQGRAPSTFRPLSDMPADATWTDDSAMCLCLAQSLLDCRGFDARDQLNRYLGWQRDGDWTSESRGVGITAAVAKALATAQWAPNPFAGSHDPQRWEAEALSRVAAVVLYSANDPKRALEWAAEQARITHQSPGILDCCRYFACLLLAAVDGRPKQEWRNYARFCLERHHGKAAKPEVARLIEAKRWPQEPEAGDSRACITALRTVLWAVNAGPDFASGLLKVVNRGGHSDVNGALFGQLAGAHYGFDAVPAAWRARIIGIERVEAAGAELLAGAPTRS